MSVALETKTKPVFRFFVGIVEAGATKEQAVYFTAVPATTDLEERIDAKGEAS